MRILPRDNRVYCTTTPLKLRVEKTHSRSSKHYYSSMVYVYRKTKGLISYSMTAHSEEKVKGIYAVGDAKIVCIQPEPGDFIIYYYFVKNYRNRVKGYISVYNHNGELLYRAKYNNGYLTRSKGNPVYAWLVRLMINSLKIPVSSTKLGDEK